MSCSASAKCRIGRASDCSPRPSKPIMWRPMRRPRREARASCRERPLPRETVKKRLDISCRDREDISSPPCLLRLLPGGSEFAGWASHPLESAALSRRTEKADRPEPQGERIATSGTGDDMNDISTHLQPLPGLDADGSVGALAAIPVWENICLRMAALRRRKAILCLMH